MKKGKEERNFNRRYAEEYHWGRTLFYNIFLRVVVDTVFYMFYDFEIHGKENIPKGNSRYIYAANHVSVFDPPIVSFVTRKPIAYMAKAELFEPTEKCRWLIKRLGAFAVNREKPELATFKTVRDIFKTKWSLGVFPQGGTFPYGKLENIKSGIAVIAKHAKADIIPIAIADFSGFPKTKNGGWKRQKFKAYIGEPISHELSEDEILKRWSEFICSHADYENCIEFEQQKTHAAV